MTSYAEIRVSTGPDRGKSFEMKSELIHIGRGEDNECILEDETVGDHQASIVQRNGRFAICSPHENTVDVDGTILPADQWVWLPETAKIKVSSRTSLIFEAPKNGDAPVQAATGDSAKAEEESSASVSATNSASDSVLMSASELDTATKSTIKRGRRKRGDAKKRKNAAGQTTIARFIRDKSGDALVRLGEDGKLPELSLAEIDQVKTETREKKKSNPAVLYAVLGFSFFMSLAMLLLDSEGSNVNSTKKTQARAKLVSYLGSDEGELKLYQKELRSARLAHARGDYGDEKQHYRHVLKLLNSEDLNPNVGVTGKGPAADQELRKLIATLLSSR